VQGPRTGPGRASVLVVGAARMGKTRAGYRKVAYRSPNGDVKKDAGKGREAEGDALDGLGFCSWDVSEELHSVGHIGWGKDLVQ
jgi:hypothetical protein